MAQIVQPNPNAIGGTTSTKVGAVIFDKPQYDPLTIQMKVMDDLDDWAKQKATADEEKKKLARDAAKDILYEPKDFLPEGAPHIKTLAEELNKKAGDYEVLAAQYGLNDPRTIAAKTDALNARSKLQIVANNLQQGAKAIKENPPDAATNMDEYLPKMVNVRVEAGKDPMGEGYNKALQEFYKPPKPEGVIEVTDAYIKEVPLKKSEEVVGKDGSIIQKGMAYKLKPVTYDAQGNVTDYGDFDLVTGAPASLAVTPRFQKAVKPMFARFAGAYERQEKGEQLTGSDAMDAAMFDFYVKEAQKESTRLGQIVSPETIYAKEELERRNQVESNETFKQETAQTKEQAAVRAAGSQKELAAENLMRWFIEIDRGSPNNYSQMNIVNDVPKYTKTFYGSKVPGSISIGETFETKTVDGKPYIIRRPDYLRYFAIDKETGIKLYASDRTIKEFEEGKRKDSPFEPYKNIAQIGGNASFVNGADQSVDNMKNYWSKISFKNKWNKDANGINLKDGKEIAPFSEDEQKRYGTTPKIIGIKVGTKIPEYKVGEVPADFTGQYVEVSGEEGKEVKATKFKEKATPATASQQQAPKTGGKTVSRATIKSKVGTKGFEGYTEQELVDYYTSQGYTIK